MRLTSPLLLMSSVAFAFVGGAYAHASSLPVCNAKHKRPADLYGSVLSGGLKPVLAAAPGPGASPAADRSTSPAPVSAATAAANLPVAAKTKRVSRAELKASFAPCSEGDRA